ncbi:hypothetical protein D3C77_699200 [compost metagenome]
MSSEGQNRQSAHTASRLNTINKLLNGGKVARYTPRQPVPISPRGISLRVSKRSASRPPTTNRAVAMTALALSSRPISVWLRPMNSCMGT